MENLMLLQIVWSVKPEIGTFLGITFRWYGILFALGLCCSGIFLYKIFKQQGISQDNYEKLLVYVFLGIFLGARIAHCLFYEPTYYLAHWWEILLPISTIKGKIVFVGYQGLASHGGGAGLICAVLLYCWHTRQKIWQTMDHLAIVTPLAGAFIRLGNLMNSEIVGAPSNVLWAFVFTACDAQPRHPAQLYEALFYFALFVAMWLMYKKKIRVKDGFYVGFAMLAICLFRFFIEYVKEVQVPFEENMTLDMGQWLSIPYIVAGIMILWITQRKNNIK